MNTNCINLLIYMTCTRMHTASQARYIEHWYLANDSLNSRIVIFSDPHTVLFHRVACWFAQEHRVTASVSRLFKPEFLALESSLRRAADQVFRKICDSDARHLSKSPTSSIEFAAYGEYGVKRIISGIQNLRQFSTLPKDIKKIFFQVGCTVFLHEYHMYILQSTTINLHPFFI